MGEWRYEYNAANYWRWDYTVSACRRTKIPFAWCYFTRAI
ncbi:autoinducer binding domain-containing protein [Cellvibrio sp. OA-2007]